MPRDLSNPPFSQVQRHQGLDGVVQRAVDQLTTTTSEVVTVLTPFKQPDGWHDMALLNSWTNYGGSYGNARYRIDPLGRVVLTGAVKRTVAGFILSVSMVLPVGYRPGSFKAFACSGNGKFCQVAVTVDGTILIVAADSATPEALLSLDGISFYAGS